MSDNVLDRRVFFKGVFLCGVEWELVGRKQFETLRICKGVFTVHLDSPNELILVCLCVGNKLK